MVVKRHMDIISKLSRKLPISERANAVKQVCTIFKDLMSNYSIKNEDVMRRFLLYLLGHGEDGIITCEAIFAGALQKTFRSEMKEVHFPILKSTLIHALFKLNNLSNQKSKTEKQRVEKFTIHHTEVCERTAIMLAVSFLLYFTTYRGTKLMLWTSRH